MNMMSEKHDKSFRNVIKTLLRRNVKILSVLNIGLKFLHKFAVQQVTKNLSLKSFYFPVSLDSFT